MKNEKVFLLTDGCMWEANKRNGTAHSHAIEVVDTETGAVQYIASGSLISLVKGKVTDIRTQEAYNKATTLPRDGQGVQKRAGRKASSRPDRAAGI